MEKEKTIPAEDTQFAVFFGESEITKEMYDEVKKFVAYLKRCEGMESENALCQMAKASTKDL